MICILLLCSTHARAALVSDLAFLTGCWSVTEGETTITEVWMKPSTQLLQGLAQIKNAGNEVIQDEFFRLEEKGGQVTFQAHIDGQKMPLFSLDETASRDANVSRAVFVNDQNRFPRRIIYARAKTGEGPLNIRLEGRNAEGKDQVLEFPLFKADCNDIL